MYRQSCCSSCELPSATPWLLLPPSFHHLAAAASLVCGYACAVLHLQRNMVREGTTFLLDASIHTLAVAAAATAAATAVTLFPDHSATWGMRAPTSCCCCVLSLSLRLRCNCGLAATLTSLYSAAAQHGA
jgi:hypothetical protein